MRRALSLVLASLFLPLATVAADDVLRIKGSDTIGGRAMPEIAEAFRKRNPGTKMTIEALGSSTAFVGLFDGSADVGESSRPINEKEQATAKELGLKLHEIVIGYDGVAVVVNAANPVKELSIAQLSGLFTGKIRNWKEVGGPDVPVRLVSRPSYSGTHSFFKEKALRRGNAKGPEEFAASAEILEENGEIIRTVASDPKAVSYVGLGWVEKTVRAVPVSPKTGDPAIVPSAETVRTGKYPLYRPLLMYVPSSPRPAVAEFLRFVISKDGSAVMTRNGFIPADSSMPLPAFLASARPAAETTAAGMASPAQVAAPDRPAAPAANARPAASEPVAAPPAAPRQREVVRVVFLFGAASLTEEAGKVLDDVAKRLKQGNLAAVITGHADAKGNAAVNEKIALSRAHTVGNGLLRRGAPPAALRVEAAGADAPVASNKTTDGRALNRRVDIELLPR
jgi:phosphate binding protein